MDLSKTGRRPMPIELVLLFAALFLAGCVGGSSDGPSDDGQAVDAGTEGTSRSDLRPTVKLGVAEWTAAKLNASIAEQIIERRLGYPVEPVPIIDTQRMLEDVAEGKIDAVLELWPSSFDERNMAMLDSGQVEDLGPLGVDGKIGWFVPRYVQTTHPELTTWEALTSPILAAEFATAETGDRGRFLGTDTNYEQFDQEIIEELDLAFDVIFSGSDAATRDELAQAALGGDEVLLFWWTPTAEVIEFDLVNLPLPERTAACEDEIASGGAQRCDYPADRLFKLGSPALAGEAPDLHRFFSEFSLTTNDQLDMIAKVEIDGRSVTEVAAEWIANHEDRWSGWIG